MKISVSRYASNVGRRQNCRAILFLSVRGSDCVLGNVSSILVTLATPEIRPPSSNSSSVGSICRSTFTRCPISTDTGSWHVSISNPPVLTFSVSPLCKTPFSESIAWYTTVSLIGRRRCFLLSLSALSISFASMRKYNYDYFCPMYYIRASFIPEIEFPNTPFLLP